MRKLQHSVLGAVSTTNLGTDCPGWNHAPPLAKLYYLTSLSFAFPCVLVKEDNNRIYLVGLAEVEELMCVEYLEQCLTHSKHWTNAGFDRPRGDKGEG